MSGKLGVGTLTCSDADPDTPLGAAAVIVVSPAATPVATPVAFTVAVAVLLLVHVDTTAGTVCPPASAAVAVTARVAPALIVALAGATVTVATSAGGVVSPSLHVPNVLSIGALQVPAPLRCSDLPMGSLPTSRTPMSVDAWPDAAPLVAVNT